MTSRSRTVDDPASPADSIALSALSAAIDEIRSAGETVPRSARDPVNQPMIRNWVEAIGDDNPIYVDETAARAAGHPGVVAPPAMIQVWTMPGLRRDVSADDPMSRLLVLFDDAGYTGVVATDCRQTYHRYLRPGDHVSISSVLGDVTGPKRTALGTGWFIDQHTTWRVGGEVVAEHDWRIFKFAPLQGGTS